MTTNIGVLSPATGGFYFGEVLKGVVDEVARAGGRVSLIQTVDPGPTSAEFEPTTNLATPVAWERLDGFVTIAWATGADYLRRLRETGKPVVMVSTEYAIDAASVGVDNDTALRAVVAHLVDHGHSRILFVGNLLQIDIGERHDTYVRAMAEHGLAAEVLHVPTTDHIEAGGARAAGAVVAAHRDRGYTAVIASTDRIALGLMRELQRSGLRVPEDVAVVGFDDVEPGWSSSPPLATVNQRFADLGAQAAALVLDELRGEPVEHRRHLSAATFVPRRSCGCGAGATRHSENGISAGHRLVAAILEHLGLDGAGGPAARGGLDDVELDALDDVIGRVLADLYPDQPSPETLTSFAETYVRALNGTAAQLEAARVPGAGVLEHCIAKITAGLSQLQAVRGLARIDRLAVSLAEQYDVGVGLLDQVDTDPSDLSWLDTVGARAACLGLWAGTPDEGRLRISGVYDPQGDLRRHVGEIRRTQEFPPRSFIQRADPANDEVAYVIPIRGSSGDHGLLCVVGPVDTEFGTGRGTYNHWAALLGVALRERDLLEEIRRSEERYSLAASATHDGLWDWNVQAAECFYSRRCQDLLGSTVDRAVGSRSDGAGLGQSGELHPWVDAVHPDDVAELRAAIMRCIEAQEPIEVEHRLVAPDGSARWVLCRAVPVGTPGEPARRVVGSLSDIHPRKELEEQLRHGALYDAVTGLANRRLFGERLSWAVEQAQRDPDAHFAVVFLDLDGFKLVNDSLGHLVGDDLLRVIGERLRSGLRAVDTAARFGGDEFALLLFGLRHDAVLEVVDRVQRRIAAPVRLGDHEVSVSASVGITTSDTPYDEAEHVLRDADIAMYHAKGTERGSTSVFDPAMHARAAARLTVQSELRHALATEQFVVHYQPVVQIAGAGLSQFEALVRWAHPERGLLLPQEFLPSMDESGTIVALGQWVIDTVCAQIARWQCESGHPVAVSVNLSHREFWSDSLPATVAGALSRHGVAPPSLILEITESVIMTDPAAARAIMVDLQETGVRLHIDDFGTGQSSLSALRTFPVDALKIDQSFIQEIGTDPQTTELVRIIVEMGRTLGLDVVAEGVETASQAEHLMRVGCVTGQGWLYARALPGPEAGAQLGSDLTASAVTQPAQG